MKKKRSKFEDDTVYMLADGRMFRLVEEFDDSSFVCIQFLDKDERSFVDPDQLDVRHSLAGPMSLITFEAARSVHVRLNKLSQV